MTKKQRKTLGRLPTGPDSVTLTLKYFETVTMTSLTTTSAWDYLFRLNSPFDPNFTGTGYQPAGFDQWSALYSKYRVNSAEWRVGVIPSDGAYGLNFCCIERGESTLDGNFYNLAMEPRSKVGFIGTRGAPPMTLTGGVTIRDIFGVTAIEYKDDDYAALISTNPANQAYLYLKCVQPGGEVPTADTQVMVEIRYNVTFFARVEQDASFRKELALLRKFMTDHDYQALLEGLTKVESAKKQPPQKEAKAVGANPRVPQPLAVTQPLANDWGGSEQAKMQLLKQQMKSLLKD